MLLSFALSALAQQPSDWQFLPGPVLSPNPAIPFMSQSIGSPTVVYDTLRNRFIMLFEAKTTATDPRCPQGIWAIGAAFSPDGINWTPFPTPIINPNPANSRFFSCVAAHPSAVFVPNQPTANGGVLFVFKAEQVNDACASATPNWGCNVQTGFGRAMLRLTAAGNPLSVTIRTSPIYQPSVLSFGYPKFVEDASGVHFLYQGYPDIISLEGPSLITLGSQDTALRALDYKSSVPWVQDEFFNPSLICDDDPAFPYATFVGGRDTNATGVVSGGWGKAIDDVWGDASQFMLDTTAQQTWTGNDAWRHFEVTKLTTDEYLVWYSQKDASGNNHIHFGGTTLTFNNADVMSRVCP